MSVKERLLPPFRDVKSCLFAETAAPGPSQPVTNLASADLFCPGMPLPSSVRAALQVALNEPSMAHYAHPLGLPALREAFGERIKEKYHYEINPNRHIFVTPGSEPALQVAFLPFLAPGDEVLIPDPSYLANHLDVCALGGVPVFVPLEENSGFSMNVSAFEEKLTPRTKMVVLTTPNNPTGTIYSSEELRALCRFIVKHDLILVCDCAFDNYVFDGRELFWPATEPGMWERTISVFTVSKGWGLCGLRVGCMVADTPVLDAILGKFPSFMGAAANLAQVGAAAALRDHTLLDSYFRCLDGRRQETFDQLTQIPGLTVTLPHAGFQFWINTSRLAPVPEVIRFLREEAHVSVNNGSSFGPSGKDHIRLVFGCVKDDGEYRQAIRRLCDALRRYPL